MFVKKIISIVILIPIILLIGCSDDKITGPKPNPLEGQWVDEYTFSYSQGIILEPSFGYDSVIQVELKSVVSFYSDSFNIKVFGDNEMKLKEQFGKYQVSADTVFFVILQNQTHTYTRTLHYEFLTPDSLYFTSIAFPLDDSGAMVIELIGVVWEANIGGGFFGMNIKNNGTFIKEE